MIQISAQPAAWQTASGGKDEKGQPLIPEARADLQKSIAGDKTYFEELKTRRVTLPTITFERSLALHKPNDRTIQRCWTELSGKIVE